MESQDLSPFSHLVCEFSGLFFLNDAGLSPETGLLGAARGEHYKLLKFFFLLFVSDFSHIFYSMQISRQFGAGGVCDSGYGVEARGLCFGTGCRDRKEQSQNHLSEHRPNGAIAEL